MNFSAWAIRKPIPSILLFILITVAGLVSFKMLSIQNFPDIDFPAVSVTASLPGATPTQMETEVTRKIEDSIASIGAIKHITSTINDGSSTTMVEFQLEKDVQEAVNDVRDSVSRIRAQLPSDVQEPVISRVTFASLPVLTYAVEASDMDAEDLSWFVDNIVNKRLLSVRGVAKVTRQGGVDREVRVQLDPVRLQALNVTAADISTQVRGMQQEAPGGRGNIGGQEQAVRTLGTVKSARELAQMDIPLSDGRRVRLSDVADVRDTAAEPRQMALFDGKPVVSFQVFRSRGASEVSVAKGVREAIAKLQAERPNVHVTEVFNMVKPVADSYKASMDALYEGAILAVLVVWLFLRDWRATFVSAVALPLSIIPTFAAMQLLDFTLNGITLLALTLVVGILVDDAIVEVENIVRHLRDGKKPLEAAMEAAQEIGLAVIATSLTLVAVFLPTAFMGGISGKFFKQFGWTASLAVLASLLVARLLTPMMAAYMLKPQNEPNRDSWIMTRYLQAARWCLVHPWKTGGMAAAFFVVSVAIIGLIPATFLPPEDWAQLQMTVESPPGSTIAQTRENTERVRKIVMQHKEVRHVYTAIGSGVMAGVPGSSGGEVRNGTLTISLTDRHDRSIKQQAVQRQLREMLEGVPGVRISFGAVGSGEQLQVVLTGDDPTTLQQSARDVMRDLRTVPGLGAITSSASLLRPEIIIRPDFARAAQQGVTAAAIGQAVRVATAGDYDVNLPKLNLPERQVYIRVELDPKARNQIETIRQLRVAGRNGAVPLENIADISIASGPAQIDRYDRSRNITISVGLEGRALGETNMAVEALPSIKNLPPGVRRIASGDVEGMQELFSSFFLAMFAGVLCVYAVLVLLFHDFTQPVTILAALPLSVGGAFGLLALFGFSLSLPALIGLLMLMGIVTKNSILLVEYAIVARRDMGMSRTDAIIDACHKRARPIVMTTVAMTAGMVPMALGLEGDAGFRAPMAVAVIGGLLTSTLLSLLVVPVVFEKVDDLKEWMLRKFRSARHHGHEGEPASEHGPR
ncbi:acrB/AcrD/AcrF family protein [Ralstonia insidiosa]|uniref:AcrB/AcrD/AcrF family protein n=1 Tax=Ralstonia insidiosa TaxID=190721 RepID=A0AAC9BN40_9RALS|nr:MULTISPECIES: efflux RND transporter permease subunit [Ralstonia]ANH75633.1 acrB/AcrD/AcrF family protein [Ralstonia insidiosa]EPX98656.1 ACR/RND family transmembrane transporter [Ralstonia sp. AU12-08]MBY4706008.1 efflux RND transporter permease subunit [Ralstonia insidiosa]GAQ27056.1 acriflavin resistance protein [Ralstonia sp. NT80]